MKPRKNLELRAWIVGHGLTYGDVAKEIPMSNSSFSGMLQMELTDEVKQAVLKAAERALSKKEGVEVNEEGVLENREEALLPD